MPDPKLTMALSHYDRHVPLFDGSVGAEGLDLEVLEIGQSHPLRHGSRRHERMLEGEFDIAELSLSSYLISQSRDMPIKAIPVFPRRLFSLSQMWVNVDAGIESPKDLVGRTVGLSTFQTTLSVLAKGDLQSEYDVPWREINWVIDRPEALPIAAEGVSIRYLEKGESIGAMLERGEIDALMMPHPPDEVVDGSDKIRRLFRDARAEELQYYRKNGFYPIMHVVAFKNEVLEKYPFAVQSVMGAFENAKTGVPRVLLRPQLVQPGLDPALIRRGEGRPGRGLLALRPQAQPCQPGTLHGLLARPGAHGQGRGGGGTVRGVDAGLVRQRCAGAVPKGPHQRAGWLRMFPFHNKYTADDWKWLLAEAGFSLVSSVQIRPQSQIFVAVARTPFE